MNWLILEINETAGECGAVDGQRPGCSVPPRITRWFMRFDTGWQVITGTRAGGCAAVQAVAPTFPSRLCAHLPPIGN